MAGVAVEPTIEDVRIVDGVVVQRPVPVAEKATPGALKTRRQIGSPARSFSSQLRPQATGSNKQDLPGRWIRRWENEEQGVRLRRLPKPLVRPNHLADLLNLSSQSVRLLKIEPCRRVLQATPEPLVQDLVASVKELHDLAHELYVSVPVGPPHAGTKTVPEVELDAG